MGKGAAPKMGPLQVPRRQSRLSTGRVILDAVGSLPSKPVILGDLRNPCRLAAEHCLHGGELLARLAAFPAEAPAIFIGLRVLDSSPLSGFRGFGLPVGSPP